MQTWVIQLQRTNIDTVDFYTYFYNFPLNQMPSTVKVGVYINVVGFFVNIIISSDVRLLNVHAIGISHCDFFIRCEMVSTRVCTTLKSGFKPAC